MKAPTKTDLRRQLFDLYYSDLNEMQRRAIYQVNGPLLVLAGAGSGKTTVLTRRIAHLIRFGNAVLSEKQPLLTETERAALTEILQVRPINRELLTTILQGFAEEPCEPSRVLAITFTNKAAGEIKERLSSILGEEAQEIWAGTFHSICVRILRQYIHLLSYRRDFTIFDADDSKKLISTILKDLEIDEKKVTPRSVQNEISRAKNAMLSPEAYRARVPSADFFYETCAEVYALYQERLRASNAVDFDDILTLCVEVLERFEAPRTLFQKRFRYVLVDEYQDTNQAQFRFVQLICAARKNVMVVGDDDQSIYKFRGATIENILSFDKTYPDATCVYLEQNYRSTGNILNAANAVIANNVGRRGKTLWCDATAGDKLRFFKLADQEEEAVFLAGEITRLVTSGLCQYRDCAVLYRAGAQANALESVFAKSGLPHRQLSGTRFYDRAEIKDILAYLCFIQNSTDDLHLARILNVPRRGIGDTTLQAARGIATEENKSLFEVLSAAESYPQLARAAGKLAAFVKLINELKDASTHLTLPEFFHAVIEQSGYLAFLSENAGENADRIDNINELVSSAVSYEEQHEDANLAGFLEEAALVTQIDNYDASADACVLMTIHSAKGLEFDYVFLPGFEESIFPSSRSSETAAELEEERRLAYVALTRARKCVMMTCASTRLLYGHTTYNPPSRFLREIPTELLEGDLPKSVLRPPDFSAATTFSKRPEQRSVQIPRTPLAPKRSPLSPQSTPPKRTYGAGARIIHPIFGEGTVLTASPMAQDVLYEIAFDGVGTKKIMGNYAKLSAKE